MHNKNDAWSIATGLYYNFYNLGSNFNVFAYFNLFFTTFTAEATTFF